MNLLLFFFTISRYERTWYPVSGVVRPSVGGVVGEDARADDGNFRGARPLAGGGGTRPRTCLVKISLSAAAAKYLHVHVHAVFPERTSDWCVRGGGLDKRCTPPPRGALLKPGELSSIRDGGR